MAKTVSVLPGGWHPPQYWAAAGLAFFGAWFAVALVYNGLARVSAVVWRLWSHPAIDVTVMAGERDVILELRHTGAPATYSADGRITNTMDGTPNPAPALFRCQLRWKGQREAADVRLRDGEWVHIVLAHVDWRYPADKRWVIRRGSADTDVTAGGVLFEITVKSDARLDTTYHVGVQRMNVGFHANVSGHA
jgi:hypothetical protein